MAKKSMLEKNARRKRMHKKYAAKRAKLKEVVMKKDLPVEERFAAQVKLSQLPRNSAKNRYRNRCELSGRPRGYHRQFRLSRIALRELGSLGMIPGLIKSSW